MALTCIPGDPRSKKDLLKERRAAKSQAVARHIINVLWVGCDGGSTGVRLSFRLKELYIYYLTTEGIQSAKDQAAQLVENAANGLLCSRQQTLEAQFAMQNADMTRKPEDSIIKDLLHGYNQLSPALSAQLSIRKDSYDSAEAGVDHATLGPLPQESFLFSLKSSVNTLIISRAPKHSRLREWAEEHTLNLQQEVTKYMQIYNHVEPTQLEIEHFVCRLFRKLYELVAKSFLEEIQNSMEPELKKWRLQENGGRHMVIRMTHPALWDGIACHIFKGVLQPGFEKGTEGTQVYLDCSYTETEAGIASLKSNNEHDPSRTIMIDLGGSTMSCTRLHDPDCLIHSKPFGGETVCFNAAKTFIQQGDRISGGEKEEKQSEILQKLLHPSSEFRRFIYDSDKIHQGEESIKLRSGDSFRPETLIEVLKQSGMIVADFFHEALQRFGGLAKTDVHVHLCGSTWTIGIVRATFMEFAGLRVDQVSSRCHSHVVSHGVLLCDRPVERLNGYVGLGMHDQSLKQICRGERFGTRVVNAPIVGEEPGDHCVEIDGERNASRWPISQKSDSVTLHPQPKITCWYRCGKVFTQHMVFENKRASATDQFEYSLPISRSRCLPAGHKKIGKDIRSHIDLSDAAEAYSLYRREDCVGVLQITDAMSDCAVPEGPSWSKITVSLDLTRQSIKFSATAREISGVNTGPSIRDSLLKVALVGSFGVSANMGAEPWVQAQALPRTRRGTKAAANPRSSSGVKKTKAASRRASQETTITSAYNLRSKKLVLAAG